MSKTGTRKLEFIVQKGHNGHQISVLFCKNPVFTTKHWKDCIVITKDICKKLV